MNKDWAAAVSSLANKVESWLSESPPIAYRELTIDPTPDEPLLQIDMADQGRLLLEPAAFAADRLPTKVHLYSYPTLRRAVLVGPDERDEWDVQSSEGVSMNYRWNRQDFLKLISILAEKHVPRGV